MNNNTSSVSKEKTTDFFKHIQLANIMRNRFIYSECSSPAVINSSSVSTLYNASNDFLYAADWDSVHNTR